ncbi:DUF397 domain-containing protein [Streptomyces sp. NPDC020299]|uniref:DUF397 domain-containing protein n=1 Tax=Streptomyces sp. NPDC020299 TaxID=3365067 RepID=UPI0037B34FB1
MHGLSQTPEYIRACRSSYSGGPDGDSCVEIAMAPRSVHVRDSKHTAGPQLALKPEAWAFFVSGVCE